ncbi:cytochrome c3 family protein [Desulfobacula phenolica]|uniref:Class III cytochrome C family protein n=1 Tax=Desulfobacula phenolica TaxID=90732 RepID=A0A1H2DQA1_9BACT|nr:cytochrome c3 family protein [Desulfobacula phenolica]SDT84954.1 Class III cytochrome C family protein [Desulfobacula phenolica]
MNSESKGLNIIFLIILISILFLSYYSIPLHDTEKHNKISKKAQTKVYIDEKDKTKVVEDQLIVKKSLASHSEPVNVPSEEKTVQSLEIKIKEQAIQEKTDSETIKPEIVESGTESNIDIISMNNPLYEKHTKGIVQFTHKQHVEKYLIACGSCHHDETGNPLVLKATDIPQGCIDCHPGTKKIKGEKLAKKEKIARYHFEALHANCIGCHRDYNKEKGDPKGKVPAPVSCTKCHPKQ